MNLEQEKNRWDETVAKPSVEKFKERKAEFLSPSGIPIPRVAVPGEFATDVGKASED